MSDIEKAYQATPAATLEQQIMDPNFPKNEREWWAADRIEQLEAEGDKARARGDTLRMALEDIAYPNPLHNEDDLMRIARAALEDRT